VSDWQAGAEEWNALLRRSVSDVPFLRFEFLRAWWETFGGGEWPDGSLWIVTGRDERGNLRSAAPLFRTSAQPTSFLLLGTHEIADYLDVLAAPADVADLARAVLQMIEDEGPPEVNTLDLWNLPEGSPGGEAFAGAAAGGGWSIRRGRLKACPRISLEGGWEGYLARLDKKQRHELRRKMRRASEHPLGTVMTRVSAGPGLDQSVDAFLHLMRLDGAKAGFLTPPMHDMFHSLTASAAASGLLRLEFLAVGDRPAAGAYSIDYADRLWIFKYGIDPEYQTLSPGWALLGHLIRSAAEEGKLEVDFLRGDEDYKYRLGGVPRYIERITLTRP
jgi:CelD/BcsL family acetyltransferase involved in cellulose biosynthesis